MTFDHSESPGGATANILVSEMPANPPAAGNGKPCGRIQRDVTSPLMSIWTLILAACGGGGGGGGGGGNPQTTGSAASTATKEKQQEERQKSDSEPGPLIAGRVVNGPVRDARVYLDINDDGQLDDGDLYVATTDNGGRFAERNMAFKGHENKALLVDLKTDAKTQAHPFLASRSPDLPYILPDILRAPPGSDVVTPLTELLVQLHGPRPTPDQIKAFSVRFGLNDRLITETDPFAPSLMAGEPALAAGLQAAARRVTEMIHTNNRDNADDRPDSRAGDRKTPDQMLREAEQVARDPPRPTITVTVEQSTSQIHENFPTTKSVFTAPQGYELVEGFEDNHLFQLGNDGRLFFTTMPDFEAPGDLDRDNIYRIRLSRREEDEDLSFINLSVTVGDLIHELYTPHPIGEAHNDVEFVAENAKPTLSFTRDDVFGQGRPVPGALTQYLLSGVAWRMPEQGPLVLTWSLVTDSNKRQTDANDVARSPDANGNWGYLSGYFIRTQEQIDQARRYIKAVLAEFERAANVRFVEVEHSQNNRGDVPIIYLFLPTDYVHIPGTPGAWAGYPGASARFVQHFDPSKPYTHYRGEPVHEIGHMMGLRHPFDSNGQRQTSWPARPELESDFSTIMSYSPKTNWVGLTPADIAVLQFLYGAPQGERPGSQRPGIESFLGHRANGERPAVEQVFQQDEPLPAPPQFRAGAEVMIDPDQNYSFRADVEPENLEVHYFIVRTRNTAQKFKVYGFAEDVLPLPFLVDRQTGDAKFYWSSLLADRLLHKQQLVAVAMDPDRPDLWSQSIKTVFAQWPNIEKMSTYDFALRIILGDVKAADDPAESARKHAAAREIIDRLLKTEDIDDDTPAGEKIADLSAWPHAKLIWKGTDSKFLKGVDPSVDAEIFPVLSDAQFFEIRDGGLYVRNTPLDHQTPRDRNSDNKYDLFIEYGAAGAEKHIAFRITVTDEAFEEEESSVMSQMVVSMDVM